MHRFFIPQPFAEEMQIIGADAHHISNVLRMRVGQHIQIVSSDRVTALMEIKALTTDAAFVRLVKRIDQVNEPSVRIILAQGLAKGEKMDFIIQKAVEVGVNTIVPVAMEYSVVKLDKNKAEKKVERWQKIAEEAAKQSKRDIVPEVTSVMDLDEVLHSFAGSAKLMAYEGETKSGLKKVLLAIQNREEILLIIGPEGGIAEKELKAAELAGAQTFSLGNRILRTETAGLVSATAILYETGDLGG
mgnify:FL=1